MVVDAVVAASRELPLGMVMLGAGSQKKRIQAQIAGNPHIRILAPERDRVKFATLLACADALIHGCEAETFCMAAAEARAAGVPVIVPDAGGAADHAAGGAGIAYRAGNALAASQAIVDLFAGRIAITGEIAAPVTMEEHFVRLFADYARVAARTAVAA
jgi:alpha-1,6-mannosyltransferase